MASGRETDSVAGGGLMSSEKLSAEELEWEEEFMEEQKEREESDDEDAEYDAAVAAAAAAAAACNIDLPVELGNGGLILVLFEMPSGFALFSYDGLKLLKPNAWQNIWPDFANASAAKRAVCLVTFQTFEDKLLAANQQCGAIEVLSEMILKHMAPDQKLAVGNTKYKEIIDNYMGISCLFNDAVEELMWGLMIQLGNFVPAKDSGLTNEDRFTMSLGMKFFMKSLNFEVEPDMLVNKNIIEMAGNVYECDRCVRKHEISLRSAAKYMKEVSQIDAEDWDLLKLATALVYICCPEEKIKFPSTLFSREQLLIFRKHARKYKDRILKMHLMVVYDDIFWARKLRYKVGRRLIHLVKQAKKEYEAEKAHPGIKAATIDELTELLP